MCARAGTGLVRLPPLQAPDCGGQSRDRATAQTPVFRIPRMDVPPGDRGTGLRSERAYWQELRPPAGDEARLPGSESQENDSDDDESD